MDGEEEWRPIKGADNSLVSSAGRVMVSGEVVNGRTKGGHGYFRVYIPGLGTQYIHRLVLEAFKVQPEGKNFANHINGNKHDNRIENLEWSTNRENLLLAAKKGQLRSTKHRTPVRVTGPDGTAKCYGSQSEAARELGIPGCNIAKCLTGDRRTTHGYRVEYCNSKDVKTSQMSIFDFGLQ